MFGLEEHIVVIHHEEEKIYYSYGPFADQYYDKNRKTEKYDFYSKNSLDEFTNEQVREHKEYKVVEVKSY